MHTLLALCIELDSTAVDTYAQLADSCSDPGVRLVFEQMGVEERSHVTWWTELQEAWEAGLVSRIADEDELLARLIVLQAEVSASMPADLASLTPNEMLGLAARLEFFMLDPAFSQLIGVIDGSGHRDLQEAYSRHVLRLVHAIENRPESDDLSRFLARALARSLQDQHRLDLLATHDVLTGLYNRRGFYGHVEHSAAWAARYRRPVSVLLIDVDHFKTVNDRYGHPVGDEVLQTVAGALADAVRGSDITGRYGGDEFAVLAPETDAEEASMLAERVLEVMRETVFSHKTGPIGVTVSVGVGFSAGAGPVTPEQLFSAADTSLYAAKDAGHDRAGAPVVASRD